MAIPSVWDTFEEFVRLFEQKLSEGNTERAKAHASMVVKTADEEASRNDIEKAVRDAYIRKSQPARDYLAGVSNARVAGEAASKEQQHEQKSSEAFIPKCDLRDIKGLQNVKDEFMVNVLAPLSPTYSPTYKKYRGESYGAQILLYGPPGTGKTFLAKCLAGTLKCHVIIIQSHEILAKYVGDSNKIMAEKFAEADKYDSCIMFFDEFDSIATSRDDIDSRHTKTTLLTLLEQMDGFSGGAKQGKHRIIISATNRPWVLDPAVLRGGRFDTQILIPLPDETARLQIAKVALGKDERIENRVDVPCADDFTLEWLAKKLDGVSGADINAICKRIVNRALRRELSSLLSGKKDPHDAVTRADCEYVLARHVNSTTNEMLLMYDAYAAGLSFDDYRKTLDKKVQEDVSTLPAYALKFLLNAYGMQNDSKTVEVREKIQRFLEAAEQ